MISIKIVRDCGVTVYEAEDSDEAMSIMAAFQKPSARDLALVRVDTSV